MCTYGGLSFLNHYDVDHFFKIRPLHMILKLFENFQMFRGLCFFVYLPGVAHVCTYGGLLFLNHHDIDHFFLTFVLYI